MFHDYFAGLMRSFVPCVFCSAIILWGLLRTGWAWSLATDTPTHRSLHTRPTPRVGGLAIIPVGAGGLFWFAPQLGGLAVAALLLAAICQIDDRGGLSIRLRFFVQFAAVIGVCFLYSFNLVWWAWPILIVALVWMTNLYNFMDGADGLAGGMALIGFGAYAIGAWTLAPALANGVLALAGAALGFLLFNLPPARLFLGDVGSIPLGFLAGTLGLIGWSAHVWPIWFPLMVFSPFIADSSLTLIRRVIRGERFWEAHRVHFYQRMIQMDGTHQRTIYTWYLLIAIGALIALLMLQLERMGHFAWVAVFGVAWIAALLTFGHWIDRRWAHFAGPHNQL